MHTPPIEDGQPSPLGEERKRVETKSFRPFLIQCMTAINVMSPPHTLV
jgi:hypothetical protein